MNEPVRPQDMRISDVERSTVQEHLRRAHDVGQLDLSEFDERVQAVWSAKTRGDLERATADLPVVAAAPAPAPGGSRQAFSDTGGGTAMRVLTIIWGSLVAVNLLVWLLVMVTAGEWIYPWPVWLIVPGAALGVLYGAGVGRPEPPR
ncbi:DUF1707 SHOCT-like domain-containing protein [Pseudonocardia sp. GCM10023141]|uniref:DUF1707 SHOCT-like domain-containing protein n=1 Tax=Pseudonocardia sp. GCM10023141 TaxID=3252653 RepID=UPI0036196D19